MSTAKKNASPAGETLVAESIPEPVRNPFFPGRFAALFSGIRYLLFFSWMSTSLDPSAV